MNVKTVCTGFGDCSLLKLTSTMHFAEEGSTELLVRWAGLPERKDEWISRSSVNVEKVIAFRLARRRGRSEHSPTDARAGDILTPPRVQMSPQQLKMRGLAFSSCPPRGAPIEMKQTEEAAMSGEPIPAVDAPSDLIPPPAGGSAPVATPKSQLLSAPGTTTDETSVPDTATQPADVTTPVVAPRLEMPRPRKPPRLTISPAVLRFMRNFGDDETETSPTAEPPPVTTRLQLRKRKPAPQPVAPERPKRVRTTAIARRPAPRKRAHSPAENDRKSEPARPPVPEVKAPKRVRRETAPIESPPPPSPGLESTPEPEPVGSTTVYSRLISKFQAALVCRRSRYWNMR